MTGDAGKAAILARWRDLDGSFCPECGEEGVMVLEETYKDDAFTLQEGGWVYEWYRCAQCGAMVGVSRRFAPASEIEVEVEGRG